MRHVAMRHVAAGAALAFLALLHAGAWAAQPPVGLGTATSFAVLAGSTVTNTGPTVVTGDLGVSPGSAVTGFPPGQVVNGTQHKADAVAAQAQADLTTAYDDAAGRTPATPVSADLGGQTLAPGVYKSSAGMGLTGTVILDGQDDANAVFVFQAGSTLITASGSVVELVRGAQACNVFWQVGSSATLGTDSRFAGTVMALSSISVQTRATVAGRVLARNGQVSLDENTITRPTCAGEEGSGDGGGGGGGGEPGSGPGSGGPGGSGPGGNPPGNGNGGGGGGGNGPAPGSPTTPAPPTPTPPPTLVPPLVQFPPGSDPADPTLPKTL